MFIDNSIQILKTNIKSVNDGIKIQFTAEEFGELIEQVNANYDFSDLILCLDANLGTFNGPKITQTAIDYINLILAKTNKNDIEHCLIQFSGTPDCVNAAKSWASHHDYNCEDIAANPVSLNTNYPQEMRLNSPREFGLRIVDSKNLPKVISKTIDSLSSKNSLTSMCSSKDSPIRMPINNPKNESSYGHFFELSEHDEAVCSVSNLNLNAPCESPVIIQPVAEVLILNNPVNPQRVVKPKTSIKKEPVSYLSFNCFFNRSKVENILAGERETIKNSYFKILNH